MRWQATVHRKQESRSKEAKVPCLLHATQKVCTFALLYAVLRSFH